jgi:hypothetical protein
MAGGVVGSGEAARPGVVSQLALRCCADSSGNVYIADRITIGTVKYPTA